ncbi:hypothetical protein FBPa19_0019 [Pseudomonas phage vB_PaeP_FBPa19]|nr:hypothetical protein FBPa19_0019 [Pseudomonas phage vB_PaeP_FBPa19]
MSIKTTGLELKAFWSDESVWPADSYVDGVHLKVNGQDDNSEDIEALNDGDANGRYSYALWEDINERLKPILAKHGFALTFRTPRNEKGVEVEGVLSHRGGHSERTSMLLPADTSGNKNAVQAVASSVSYGKRYTAGALLNYTTHGEDDDAFTAAAAENDYERLVKQYQASVDAIKLGIMEGDYSTAAEEWFTLDEETKTKLWKAPSKGGCFTTKEREIMKSSEFRKAYYGETEA